MQSYTVRFHVDAPPRKVWRVLHPPAPPNSPKPRVLEWQTGSMEILNEGDEPGDREPRNCKPCHRESCDCEPGHCQPDRN